MTSTTTLTANAAPATGCADPVSNKKVRHAASVNSQTASDANEEPAKQARQTKASLVEALLSRAGGASLEALCGASGWQAHTCRAFLTGLRKRGREVIRASDKDGKSIYLITTDWSPNLSPTDKQIGGEGN